MRARAAYKMLAIYFVFSFSTSVSQSFAQDVPPKHPFSQPRVGDFPGDVSNWTDYRGREFAGYASISPKNYPYPVSIKKGSRSTEELSEADILQLESLWKKYRTRLAKDAHAADTSVPIKTLLAKDWDSTEHSLYERRQHLDARKLKDAYLDFNLVYTISARRRTLEYFEECRNALIEFVGIEAVQDLEKSWQKGRED